MVTRSSPLLAAFCVLALIAVRPAAAEPTTDQQIIHILNRLGYGPTPEAVAHVKAVGIDRYIDEQLNPESIPDPPALTERFATLDTLRLDAAQLFAQYGPLLPTPEMKPTPDEQKARRERARIILQQAMEARVWRALYSPRQLQEVMVDFWF